MNKTENIINKVTAELSCMDSYGSVFKKPFRDVPMPSIDELHGIMELLKKVIFPGFFAHSDMNGEVVGYYIGANLDKIFRLLTEQVKRGYCFFCGDDADFCGNCDERSKERVTQFVARLPEIRRLLLTDVDAAFKGDPAAMTKGETVFCYPSITAMIHHRVAHELLILGVPLIPRIFSEMSHKVTGIDIHPGASIAEGFFMDHGTGIVVGETCVIGRNVTLYQGVTLGAKSFPRDKEGNLLKGIPRHPVVEDNVTIYAGSTILGRINIGHDTVIGGNVWVTEDIPAGSKVLQNRAKVSNLFGDGGGI